MATLVLSTVGTALGGPVGSAIGALVGQSIDQTLLAPKSRGPRVGDLAVQTSSYGTQIPRIYGTMRVAGSVVWATDLVERAHTGGAKGQPDVAYGYTVSLAVALSSRQVRSVKRIWADGKLLRGVDGDFKVGTTFRFYDGSEDQPIDPLIASIEGIANTPAFRGLALAVFEDLELADYGNRIPFLTFEAEADDSEVTVGSILSDASAGAISSDEPQRLTGFAAYGSSIRSAIEPLVECFDLSLLDDGQSLRAPNGDVPLQIANDELGHSADGEAASRLQRERSPARSVAGALCLTFYDPVRDYQTSEARAVAEERASSAMQIQLPAVIGANEAKSIAQQMLARGWSRQDRLTLRLPPSRIGLEPGAIVQLPLSPSSWRVEKVTLDGFVVIAELSPSMPGRVSVAAESGRIVPNADTRIGEITLALLDVPRSADFSTGPALMLAASTPSPGWKRQRVEMCFGGQSITVETARSKSVLGRAETMLEPGGADVIDEVNEVDVALIDPDQWLTSCDDDALSAGRNLAIIGRELIQFGRATALGGGKFRLGRLMRGRNGTEFACAGHSAFETFCLIERGTMTRVEVPSLSIGSVIEASIGGRFMTSAAVDQLHLDAWMGKSHHVAAIEPPSGGATIDREARNSIDQILGALREYGLIDAGSVS